MQPASKTQVGGDHYKNMVIQPVEFINRNRIGYIEGSVIKYVCRHRSKNGRQDLEKAKHFLDLLIEQEYGGVPVADHDSVVRDTPRGVPSDFVFCDPSPDGPKTMYPDEATRRAARDQAEKDFAKWKRDTEEAVAKAQASVVRETPKFDPNAVIQPKIHTPTTFGLTGREAALFEKVYGSSPEAYVTRTDKRSFDQAWNAVREAIKVVDTIDADAAQAKAALAPKQDDFATFPPDGINVVLDGMTKDEVWEYTSEFNRLPRQDARVLKADALMARISFAKERAKQAVLEPRPIPSDVPPKPSKPFSML